jgi:cell division protein ZapA
VSNHTGIVPVQIRGQRYPIRSNLDPRYIAELASYVDEKMRAAAESSPTTDALRLAVLAALNIADEYFRCQENHQLGRGTLAERTNRIEELVDQALRLAAD